MKINGVISAEARLWGGFGGKAPPNTKFLPPKFVKVSTSITEDEYIILLKQNYSVYISILLKRNNVYTVVFA